MHHYIAEVESIESMARMTTDELMEVSQPSRTVTVVRNGNKTIFNYPY